MIQSQNINLTSFSDFVFCFVFTRFYIYIYIYIKYVHNTFYESGAPGDKFNNGWWMTATSEMVAVQMCTFIRARAGVFVPS